MKNILTPEEKKSLRQTCRYTSSLGLKNPLISIYKDDLDYRGLNVRLFSEFSNAYNVEVPEVYKNILLKIMTLIEENSMIEDPDVDDINGESIDISLDCEDEALTVKHYWSFYEVEDTETREWNLKEDPEIKQILDDIRSEFPKYGFLEIRYNGSGDSGYIESNFESGESVPSSVEDWCYEKLENNFGGWEINEGSSGIFEFDLNKNTIVLAHSENIESNDSKTIIELDFSK